MSTGVGSKRPPDVSVSDLPWRRQPKFIKAHNATSATQPTPPPGSLQRCKISEQSSLVISPFSDASGCVFINGHAVIADVDKKTREVSPRYYPLNLGGESRYTRAFSGLTSDECCHRVVAEIQQNCMDWLKTHVDAKLREQKAKGVRRGGHTYTDLKDGMLARGCQMRFDATAEIACFEGKDGTPYMIQTVKQSPDGLTAIFLSIQIGTGIPSADALLMANTSKDARNDLLRVFDRESEGEEGEKEDGKQAAVNDEYVPLAGRHGIGLKQMMAYFASKRAAGENWQLIIDGSLPAYDSTLLSRWEAVSMKFPTEAAAAATAANGEEKTAAAPRYAVRGSVGPRIRFGFQQRVIALCPALKTLPARTPLLITRVVLPTSVCSLALMRSAWLASDLLLATRFRPLQFLVGTGHSGLHRDDLHHSIYLAPAPSAANGNFEVSAVYLNGSPASFTWIRSSSAVSGATSTSFAHVRGPNISMCTSNPRLYSREERGPLQCLDAAYATALLELLFADECSTFRSGGSSVSTDCEKMFLTIVTDAHRQRGGQLMSLLESFRPSVKLQSAAAEMLHLFDHGHYDAKQVKENESRLKAYKIALPGSQRIVDMTRDRFFRWITRLDDNADDDVGARPMRIFRIHSLDALFYEERRRRATLIRLCDWKREGLFLSAPQNASDVGDTKTAESYSMETEMKKKLLEITASLSALGYAVQRYSKPANDDLASPLLRTGIMIWEDTAPSDLPDESDNRADFVIPQEDDDVGREARWRDSVVVSERGMRRLCDRFHWPKKPSMVHTVLARATREIVENLLCKREHRAYESQTFRDVAVSVIVNYISATRGMWDTPQNGESQEFHTRRAKEIDNYAITLILCAKSMAVSPTTYTLDPSGAEMSIV